MVKNISNLGDAAVYCDFGSEVNETINATVINYFHHISKLIKDKIKKGLPAIHQYHPYDHPKFVSKFLKHWKPNMAVFLESDFWPNLIYLTTQTKIPTILASSQMSEKSARFWSGIGIFLAKKIFGNVNQVLAVDPKQADLFKRLGAKNIKSLTSLKSIAEKPIINQDYIYNIRKNLVKKKILSLIHI
mgnify:CR=1 FL=1